MNVDPLLRFFAWEHLRPAQAGVARRFAEMAAALVECLPDNEERHAALRKLLEAKDCAVRASLPELPPIADDKPLPALPRRDAAEAA